MNVFKHKRLLLILLCSALFLTAGIRICIQPKSAAAFCRFPEQVLILDAGHGGEDGGAVAVSGTPESSINLSVVLKIDQFCGLYGIHSVLIRSEDKSLADASAKTIREKKRSDLLNRTKLVNETPGAVLLSVHQNNYPKASSHGAQVFFHDDEKSRLWASTLQESLRQSLDPSNQRQAAKIPDSVYLMNHINCTAVLAECGFLSNPSEDVLLENDAYQTKIAAVLTSSYLLFDYEYQGENLT